MTEQFEGLTETFGNLFQTHKELETPEEGTIVGEIPEWLRGTFIRVGPGLFDLGEDFTMNHWFDGYAILYKFDISSQSVKFMKKFLKSGVYERAKAAGKPVVTEFGTRAYPEPKKGFFSRLLSNVMPLEVTDNGFGAVYRLGSEVFAASDNSFFQGVDPKNLNSLKKYDSNKLFSINMITPHPLVDDNGDIYNVGFSIGAGSKFNIVRIPAGSKSDSAEALLKKAKVVSTFPCRSITAMPFIHSFGLTKNYIIIVEPPVTTPISSLATCIMQGSCFHQMVEWKQDARNRFIVVEKSSGKIVSKVEYLSQDSFFFWHFINCYEDEHGQIVIDVNAYPNKTVVDSMMIKELRAGIIKESDPSTPQRFVVPVVAKDLPEEGVNLVKGSTTATAKRSGNVINLTSQSLSKENGMELPAINRQFQGKCYKHFYGASCFNASAYTSAIGKTNNETKETIFWKSSHFEFPGEPYFIPNPRAEPGDEDDGVLLSAVSDVRPEKDDYLLILDAKDLSEIARANFKANVPQGLHGTWVPEGEL